MLKTVHEKSFSSYVLGFIPGLFFNKQAAHEAVGLCFTYVLLRFDDFCDLLLKRRTTKWKLFVL